MISIVIVNWNSGPFLEKCVRSVCRYGQESEVIVVDNGSDDSSMDFASGANLKVIRNSNNLGFAAGNNLGWRTAKGEMILFLNPDTETLDGSVESLARAISDDPCVWAVGGQLVSPAGEIQKGFNVRSFPTIAAVASEMMFLDEVWPGNPWTRHYRMSGWDHASARDVDQPAAACLIMTRTALEELKGFDESFHPAWFEDVDLCKRIRSLGGRVRFEPSARFLHHGGSSLRRLEPQEFLQAFHRNQIRYFRKHYGAKAAVRVRALIVFGMYLRAAISIAHPATAAGYRKAAKFLAGVSL